MEYKHLDTVCNRLQNMTKITTNFNMLFKERIDSFLSWLPSAKSPSQWLLSVCVSCFCGSIAFACLSFIGSWLLCILSIGCECLQLNSHTDIHSHTQTHTHTHTHTQTHTRTHTQKHTLTHTHTHTHTQTHTHAHTQKHTHTHSHTHPLTHTHTYAHTHSLTHTHILTHTHTHTHTQVSQLQHFCALQRH